MSLILLFPDSDVYGSLMLRADCEFVYCPLIYYIVLPKTRA